MIRDIVSEFHNPTSALNHNLNPFISDRVVEFDSDGEQETIKSRIKIKIILRAVRFEVL